MIGNKTNSNMYIYTNGRFTFERIHNTKEQIYIYERAEIHEEKVWMFKSFKWANFPGKHPNAGMDQWMLERVS